jgi:hypothetical protein
VPPSPYARMDIAPPMHVAGNYVRCRCDVSAMALGGRVDFFFATSAVVELPTFAPLFPGLESPADFAAPGLLSSSTFLGFERPTPFTAFCVFSGCAGCRGGLAAASGNVVATSWTCIPASNYGRRYHLNMHVVKSPSKHKYRHLTCCVEPSNNYDNSAKRQYTLRRHAKMNTNRRSEGVWSQAV